MPHRADKQRRWVVLLVGCSLWGALPVAIALNDTLGGWSFISFEHRNVLFFVWLAFIFGVISQSRSLRVSRGEVFEGVTFFALFLVVGLVFLYLRGWWFGAWTLIPPVLFFVSQTGAFLCGRWMGQAPRHKLRNPPGPG